MLDYLRFLVTTWSCSATCPCRSGVGPTPSERVKVKIAGQSLETEANQDGTWKVQLAPLKVGDPLTLVVDGKNRVERSDILVGEVWICSGQSNMAWTVAKSKDGDLQIQAAQHPRIRLLTVDTPGGQTPLKDFQNSWQTCSPASVKEFSAVGYFFGQQLHQTLDVPIGLIDNAWGGSACEAWIRRDLLQDNRLYQPLLERWHVKEKAYESGESQAKYEKELTKWKQDKQSGWTSGKKRPKPANIDGLMKGQHRPANLYNGRLQPVLPFAIRGAIWYQGESNVGRAVQYREMFPLMIDSWRKEWGQGDFPFYWVQLADYLTEKPRPGESEWAELREAQTRTLDRLPNTGQAVIIDIGEANDIHPRNKVEVGLRLARWALARDYGIEVPYKSPRFASMTAVDGRIRVKFKDSPSGLRTFDINTVKGFAIAGEDRRWVWADAKITAQDEVEVWSEHVPAPIAVRYAWADNPVSNLMSSSGLPVTPFRSDSWPEVTADAR